MRHIAVRPRPLQLKKQIRVYHLAADGSFISENGDRVTANLYELEDCVSGILSTCLCLLRTRELILSILVFWNEYFLKEKMRAIFSLDFFDDFLLTTDVVARENILYEQGSDLDSEASDPDDSQLRLGGISYLQAFQWIHQIHSADGRGREEQSGIQP